MSQAISGVFGCRSVAGYGGMKRLDDKAKLALSRAVQTVEAASRVEVVVAVRPESLAPHQAYALAPPIFAVLGLLFLVESPWPFSNFALWLDTALFAFFGFWLCKWFPTFGRLFILPSARRRAVAQAAYKEWFERRVAQTRERTGLLLYVSQRERGAKVLCDSGIQSCVVADELAARIAQLERVAESTADGEVLARALEDLTPWLASCLPRRHDDINELADEVSAS
jgi:putative membrane protein